MGVTTLSFFRAMRHHKWMLLLAGIVALLVVSPISGVFDDQDNVITPIAAVVLIAVALGTTEKRAIIGAVTSLAIVWLIISILTDGSGLFVGKSQLAPVLFLILLAAIFVLLIRWLIRIDHINKEVLCAAVCGYLLIGILWTGFYSIAKLIDPNRTLVSGDGREVPLSDMLYFSYTTLTTTGFGDIVPKNPVVRMMAVMEAIVGTFYNTIVIARFVGLYGVKSEKHSSS